MMKDTMSEYKNYHWPFNEMINGELKKIDMWMLE